MSDSDKSRRHPLTRLPVIAVVLVSLGAVIGGGAYWAMGEEEPVQKHCEGYLKREAISLLAGGDPGDYEPSWTTYVDATGGSKYPAAKERGDLSRCGVSLPNGDVAEFRTSTAWEEGPYRPAPIGANWYNDATPLGSGVSGWTEQGYGVVLLPDACAEKFPSQGEPVQVALKLRQAYWGNLPAPPQSDLAKALVSYASTMAELEGCGAKDFRLTGDAPEKPSPQPLPDGDHCALPGFIVPRPQDSGPALEQTVVGSAGDSWSCVVGRELDGEEPQPAVAFALSTHQQALDRYDPATHRDNENTRAELVTCAGKEYLAILVFGAEDAEDPSPHMEQGQKLAETRLKSKEELYQDFLAAAKTSLGCPAAPGR
ncbi:hypothetical protein [Streptomyces sp. WMMC1477]|uniref:hypothetical protein n=1 Tax=Streptomyces sp. WMMC1477 TaxID=3015155 RepID=UPI0022B69C34|nr:hypothetical protein [Streptomyces sp. WMMC1477]MCZ7432397.1 hypothetical protein [Streptomyces sp. WMMC1477]